MRSSYIRQYLHSYCFWAHWEKPDGLHAYFSMSFFPLTFCCRLATSQQSGSSCLLNQCTFTTYFLSEEDQINWSCTAEKIFNPFNLFTIAQKQTFTFPHFEDGRHLQHCCHEATSLVFLFPFLRWPFSWTEKNNTDICLSEYTFWNIDMKYGTFIMPLHSFLLFLVQRIWNTIRPIDKHSIFIK